MKKKLSILLFIAMLFVCVDNVYAATSANCSSLLTPKLIDIIKNDIFRPMKFIVPIIFVIVEIIDFAKIVFDSNKEGLDKAFSRFIKRAIVTAVIFFVPTLLSFLYGLINNAYLDSCINQIS